ncbi:hypothetical protein PilKf_01747 [Pillotina sp. SPG140]|jgi:biopolymer transport protein ExbD
MRIRKKRKTFIIPLNSMSDVAFLLLIFIMLISLINYTIKIPIEYPEAEQTDPVNAEVNIEIFIDQQGIPYIEGVQYDLEGIRNVIVDAYTAEPTVQIHIVADKRTEFRHVNTVLSILQMLQYRVVSFIAKDIQGNL